MTPFRDLPIRRKVTRLIVLTSTIVVLLTGAAFVGYEWITFRREAVNTLGMLARVVGANSTAAIRFGDRAEVQELLATLRTEKPILAAAVFDPQGARLAGYGPETLTPAALRSIPDGGHRFSEGRLELYAPIVHEDRQVGTVCIVASMAPMHRRFLLYGVIVILVLAAESVLAFALSASFQQQITRPIQELAATAKAITESRDYASRASRYGNDELGALTDAFNRMVAEIKEREERLSASEERLRAALAAADMGTWRYNLERRESQVDENFRRIYSLPGNGLATAAELKARIHPDDLGPLNEAFQRALRSSEAQFVFEYRVLSTNDRVRWVRDRGRVVRRADGTVDYVTGALVDITDRKQSEEEIQRLNADLERRVAQRTAELELANRELEAFTYSVSHDLRGPLRHIMGYAELIQAETGLSEEAQRHLQRIVRAAEKLTHLIDSLLNLSRIGRRELVRQETDLNDLVDGALRELEGDFKNRRVKWHRSPLPVVECDPALMAVVFANLLSNALKYTRTREVAEIAIGTETIDGAKVVFVRDNGVGYDPRFQQKLFHVFERLHNASEFEGTGVGLALVERIIRKHGGRIWAEGAINGGATFRFTLPGMDRPTADQAA